MKIELRPIDKHFADFICSESSYKGDELWICAALASNSLGNGHICNNLGEVADSSITMGEKTYKISPLDDLILLLRKSETVGEPGLFRPLILDHTGRLYLHKYWKYEKDLAESVLQKAASAFEIEEEILKGGIARLFPVSSENLEIDWQAVTAIAALHKKFCIVSGGPGTGKTSTVVKIVALVLEQKPEEKIKVSMAAPTGKAAVRLQHSINSLKKILNCSEAIKNRISSEVSTIHKLLGYIPNSSRFRYNRDNPLPADLVIIDEASMVDLPLMAKLVTAVKPEARLILLGDRDQLASVEAGAVLGDLCGGGENYSSEFHEIVKKITDLELPEKSQKETNSQLLDTLVVLKKNFRFGSESGIGRLATAINAGDPNAALEVINSKNSQIVWGDLPEPDKFAETLKTVVIQMYNSYIKAENVREALEQFDKFRILCATRKSVFGVENTNEIVEKILAESGYINRANRFYHRRPIMITANDNSSRLYNGDIGIVWSDSESDRNPKVYFIRSDGTLRSISPLRIPSHETVYAMTVHKSQGSEFESLLLILPDQENAILSRELLYTAVTRGVKKVAILGKLELFFEAIKRKINRNSGLLEKLNSKDCNI